MYQFGNFWAHNDTLNSTFCGNTKISIILEIYTKNSKIAHTKVHKMVHLVS